jgi:tRNA pseudouridine38-40 synthase
MKLKVGFSRCARTDKGVHARGQVVSLKLLAIPNALTLINEALPDSIHVYGLVPVQNSFNAHTLCDSRR